MCYPHRFYISGVLNLGLSANDASKEHDDSGRISVGRQFVGKNMKFNTRSFVKL